MAQFQIRPMPEFYSVIDFSSDASLSFGYENRIKCGAPRTRYNPNTNKTMDAIKYSYAGELFEVEGLINAMIIEKM
jgi:hypothetical protein